MAQKERDAKTMKVFDGSAITVYAILSIVARRHRPPRPRGPLRRGRRPAVKKGFLSNVTALVKAVKASFQRFVYLTEKITAYYGANF
jgi:hypothetical protein